MWKWAAGFAVGAILFAAGLHLGSTEQSYDTGAVFLDITVCGEPSAVFFAFPHQGGVAWVLAASGVEQQRMSQMRKGAQEAGDYRQIEVCNERTTQSQT